MFSNPFSPIFGGLPDFFFGREDILERFDYALRDPGSDDRTLFITGTRGSGKTALLEQLSQHAVRSGRNVIDLGPENAVEVLVRSLVRHGEETRTVDPQASVTVLGTGGSLRGGSISKTVHYDARDLALIFPEACERERGGLLITIDEIQKVPIDDVSRIGNAFQLVSRKGYDAMIAVAGLPHAHDDVIHHDGCTFFRRAPHEELGLFTWEEAADAYGSALGRIRGLSARDEALDALNEASYGHPYLMQLLGYHLVLDLNERAESAPYTVTADDVARIVPPAVLAYERRALRPLVGELTAGERSYLRAMGETLDDERLAQTSAIVAVLGKEQRQLSKVRDSLLRKGIIAAPARGQLMFNVPLLSAYIAKEPRESRNVRIARMRRV